MDDDASRRLAVYLRDHYAGSAAGLALVRRSRKANEGTPLGATLSGLETEIVEDQASLRRIMDRLAIAPSRVKAAVGSIGELVGRLKVNGHLSRYSPSSRVVELEALTAGVVTKRNLWRALQGQGDRRAELDAAALEALVARADSQIERLLAAHADAAATAFAPVEEPPRP